MLNLYTPMLTTPQRNFSFSLYWDECGKCQRGKQSNLPRRILIMKTTKNISGPLQTAVCFSYERITFQDTNFHQRRSNEFRSQTLIRKHHISRQEFDKRRTAWCKRFGGLMKLNFKADAKYCICVCWYGLKNPPNHTSQHKGAAPDSASPKQEGFARGQQQQWSKPGKVKYVSACQRLESWANKCLLQQAPEWREAQSRSCLVQIYVEWL